IVQVRRYPRPTPRFRVLILLWRRVSVVAPRPPRHPGPLRPVRPVDNVCRGSVTGENVAVERRSVPGLDQKVLEESEQSPVTHEALDRSVVVEVQPRERDVKG